MPAPNPTPPFFQPAKAVTDVADPLNVSSDIAPADRKSGTQMPPEDEAKWVRYGRERFTDARNSARRQDMENRTLASLSVLDEGAGQWFHWTGSHFYDTRGPLAEGEAAAYVSDPQILPILDRVASLATGSAPDANARPVTTAPLDQMAAEEARGILGQYEAETDTQGFLLDAVSSVTRASTGWALWEWDSGKDGLLPEIGPDGSIRKVTATTTGGVRVSWVPWYHGFPYADVADERKMRGFIVARMVSLTELAREYGEDAADVDPDGDGAVLNYFQSRYAYMAGQFDYVADSDAGRTNKTLVTVYDLRETASPVYPDGLRLVWAGHRLIHKGALYSKPARGRQPLSAQTLPVAPLTFRRRPGTPWGGNVVYPLISMQRALNRSWTDEANLLAMQKNYLLVPEGAEIGQAFSKDDRPSVGTVAKRFFEKVFYRMGFKPDAFVPPPPSPVFAQVRAELKDDMRRISGVLDVLQGFAPASDSGVKVQALQQAAKTQLALFSTALEYFVREVYQGVVTTTAAYADTRLLLSDARSPGQGAGAAALEALTAGGQARVRLTPGSLLPKFPEAADEELNTMLQGGAFAPQNLAATIEVLKLKSWAGSSDLADRLVPVLEQLQAQAQQAQPNPAALQAQQAQAAQAAQATQQQHAAELEALQQAHVKESWTHDAQMEAVRQHHALELENARRQAALELEHLKGHHAALRAQTPQPPILGE